MVEAIEQLAMHLSNILNECTEKMKMIPEPEFSLKPSPSKWSKKELLGHLIDSAQNNLRRFVVTQYESKTPQIIYDPDFWVVANGYQEMKQEEVILFWKLFNERICEVLRSMPESVLTKECNTGKEQAQLHTLEWLAHDYVKHMKYHLNQLLPGSFPDIVY